jgi:hypothetical protein
VLALGPFLRQVAKERFELESTWRNFKNRTLAKSARMRHPNFKTVQKLAHSPIHPEVGTSIPTKRFA